MAVEIQVELPLPFPELAADMPLLPARMVNEYQYCPRLAYLEWVQGEWSDSADTVESRYGHRNYKVVVTPKATPIFSGCLGDFFVPCGTKKSP